jgi:hypothetical protein
MGCGHEGARAGGSETDTRRRPRHRQAQAAKPKSQRNAPGHLIEGAVTQGWREALAAFDGKWPGRIPVTAM